MNTRPIRVDGDIAYVTLTKGYEAVIDAADVHLVEGWSWYALIKQRTVYACRSDYSDGRLRKVRMHRALMAAQDGFEVDHRNGNGLDNRRSSNLRLATPAQNQHNQRLSRSNTSGFKGVCWDKGAGKWMAYINLGGKGRYLGRYETPELAHAAYAAASAELHGEFGRAA